MTEQTFSHFRSEEMSLWQIYIKKDATYSCISELGEIGLVHFNNLNRDENALGLRFVREISQCDDMLRILRYIRQEITEADISISELGDDEIPASPHERDIIELRGLLENMEAELLGISRNYVALRNKYSNILEINDVLEKADGFLLDMATLTWSDSLSKTLLQDTNDLKGVEVRNGEGPRLSYLTGTIPIENFFAFERVLWRVCYGNFLIRHAEIEEGLSEGAVKKFVFMVFFVGDLIEQKIRKICQGFRTSLYQCPESSKARLKKLESMETKLKDLQIVLEQTDYQRRRLLTVAAKDISYWRIKLKKATAVYCIMNQMTMDEGEKYLIAECWIPKRDTSLVQQALYRGAKKAGSIVLPILMEIKIKHRTPPTYSRTNRITHGFQMLIDSYGIGNYQELSPTPFTIVTFPFLFAIMFGDFGQGILLVLFSGWMVIQEKALMKMKIKSEIFNIILGGRYIILAMGLFSIYSGVIYNEIFSKSFNTFGSAWKIRFNESTVLSNKEIRLDPAKSFRSYPHVFGIDPVWDTCDEKSIVTINSFKMKISIIFGVVHMSLGMGLATWNQVFFKNYIDLFGTSIPQMIFFSLFVYLAFLIFLKWAWYSAKNSPPYNSHCAPLLLITFIDMLLFRKPGSVPVGCQYFMFKHQGVFQKILVTLAFLCIPVMLFSKPMYLYWKRTHRLVAKKKIKLSREKRVTFSKITKLNNGTNDGLTVRIVSPPSEGDASSICSTYSTDSDDDLSAEEWHKLDMTEVFINQAIRTIESVLGTVSHTASYLRLWALSLAHEQLSEVLWSMVLGVGLRWHDWMGGIVLALTFSLWSSMTVILLISMEGLSAFLHTLRLHWVEFQSKFYSGTGVPFRPFNFKAVIAAEDEPK